MAGKKKATKSTEPVVVETKEQKLKRLAAARVSAALVKIRLIGNLAAYKPTPEQSQSIIAALNEAVSVVESKLTVTTKEVSSTAFTL